MKSLDNLGVIGALYLPQGNRTCRGRAHKDASGFSRQSGSITVHLSKDILGWKSSKSRRRDDVRRNVNKKHLHGSPNLLWCESLGEKMQCDNEGRVRIPIGEMNAIWSAWRICSSVALEPARATVTVLVMPAGNVLPSNVRARSPANSVKMAWTFLRTES
jgi:hypothetical protein